jgi:hypothetical protein
VIFVLDQKAGLILCSETIASFPHPMRPQGERVISLVDVALLNGTRDKRKPDSQRDR